MSEKELNLFGESVEESAPRKNKKRTVKKSSKAYRTISEAAEELELAPHVLRFWESKFPEVAPMKRGGGRRYYNQENIAALQKIKHLLYSEGYTIRGVQTHLKKQSDSSGKHEEKVAEARVAATEIRHVLAELRDVRSILDT